MLNYRVSDLDELREKYGKWMSEYDSYPIWDETQIKDETDVQAIISMDSSVIKVVVCNTTLKERLAKITEPNPEDNAQ
jgi:hypothetical protein